MQYIWAGPQGIPLGELIRLRSLGFAFSYDPTGRATTGQEGWDRLCHAVYPLGFCDVWGNSGPGYGISHPAFSPVSSQSKRALRFPNMLKINQSIESMGQAMATKL